MGTGIRVTVIFVQIDDGDDFAVALVVLQYLWDEDLYRLHCHCWNLVLITSRNDYLAVCFWLSAYG